MSWLNAYRKSTPAVPDDRPERLRLISDSETRLAAVQDRAGVVMDASIALRKRNDQNHFAEGLQAAFGGWAPPATT